jgi:hypothetical protein
MKYLICYKLKIRNLYPFKVKLRLSPSRLKPKLRLNKWPRRLTLGRSTKKLPLLT